jgi:caffeoyl-CoA O-methyltransferase
MEKGYGQSDPRLAAYVERVFGVADPVLEGALLKAKESGLPAIQVSPFDGRILELLARLVGAERAVEIGTLAGYSAINILRGLREGGRLWTFEYEPKHARIAEENLRRAGFEKSAQVLVGSALDRLPEIEGEGPFDLVFIDADKTSYPRYLAWAEAHLRIGGLVAIDNAFAWGNVADPKAVDADESARAIHETNVRLASGGRFRGMMLPTSEGMGIGVKIR